LKNKILICSPKMIDSKLSKIQGYKYSFDQRFLSSFLTMDIVKSIFLDFIYLIASLDCQTLFYSVWRNEKSWSRVLRFKNRVGFLVRYFFKRDWKDIQTPRTLYMIVFLPFSITYNLFIWGKFRSTTSAFSVLF
jgi:hypothetical protein